MVVDVASVRGRVAILAALMVAVLVAVLGPGVGRAATPSAANKAEIASNYGKLPLRFEANQGQTDSRVKFLVRGKGYGLFLTEQEAVLALSKRLANGDAGQPRVQTEVVRMQLAGASARQPVGGDVLPGNSNYMLGSDSAAWHKHVPGYSSVLYANVYPGVDLVYHGNQQQLEYDFVVAVGADPKPIRWHFEGVQSLALDPAGNLVITAGDGGIAFQRPVVYQLVHGRRKRIAGRFRLLPDHSAGFRLGSYDRSKPLVIDPTLVYSTFLGGSNLDQINAIAVDSSGAAYLTGTTQSTDYPVTPGVFQTSYATAFVTKMNASGSALIYSTFLGGSSSYQPANVANAIAVDSTGNAYVVGLTSSTGFPVTKGAFQTTFKATAGGTAGFVTKINPSGTALVYSTFLGGTNSDGANSMALDSAGDVYVAGYTYSKDFPTTAGVVQPTNNSYPDSGWNEYVAKLNPAGASLLYATCLGGSGDYGSPQGIRVAVDGSGDAFVAATVLSTDFPVTSGVFQKASNAASGYGNMTVAKLNPTATKLLYATYLGGSSSPYGDDVTNGLAVDSAGNAYLAGTTHETNYPVTTGAYETTNKTGGNGPATGFITKMNATASALVYSTYLGGSGGNFGDYLWALALDGSGDVYVTGTTGSTDYPVTANAYQKTNPGNGVVMLTEMNPAGNGLIYSTYMGGANSYDDTGFGIALGANGSVYLAGIATGSDFPITPGVYESTFNSENFTTGFVAEFALGTAPNTLPTAVVLTSSANPAPTGSNLTFSASVYSTTGKGIPAGNVVFNIDQVNVATVAVNSEGYAVYTTKTPLALGLHGILASYGGSTTYSASGGNIKESITAATPAITPAGGIYAAAPLVTITDKTPGTTLYYTTDGSLPSSTPSSTSTSVKYTGPIVVSTSQVIRAIAGLSNAPDGAVATEAYQLITAPYALAVPATAIATPKATLNGLANTYGLAGTYSFQYGTSSTALTSSTPTSPLSTSGLGSRLSFAPVYVNATLTNLASKTTYYYRVVITTSGGTSSGQVLSFTTN